MIRLRVYASLFFGNLQKFGILQHGPWSIVWAMRQCPIITTTKSFIRRCVKTVYILECFCAEIPVKSYMRLFWCFSDFCWSLKHPMVNLSQSPSKFLSGKYGSLTMVNWWSDQLVKPRLLEAKGAVGHLKASEPGVRALHMLDEKMYCLVVWWPFLDTIFPEILGIFIIPIDELIFFRGSNHQPV